MSSESSSISYKISFILTLIFVIFAGMCILHEYTWKHIHRIRTFSSSWSISSQNELAMLQHIIEHDAAASLELYIMLNWHQLHEAKGQRKLQGIDWLLFSYWRRNMYALLNSVAEFGSKPHNSADFLALATAAYCPSTLEDIVQHQGEIILETPIENITYHNISPLYMLVAGPPFVTSIIADASIHNRTELLQKLLSKKSEKIPKNLNLPLACSASYNTENTNDMHLMLINKLELTNREFEVMAFHAFLSDNGLSLLKEIFHHRNTQDAANWDISLMKQKGKHTNDYKEKVNFLEQILHNCDKQPE